MTALYPVVVDINGVFRGKRLPASATEKVFKGNLKLPASTLHVDIFGRDAIDSGLVLEVVCTDPGSMRDFEVFASQSGNELVGQKEAGGAYWHWLRKA